MRAHISTTMIMIITTIHNLYFLAEQKKLGSGDGTNSAASASATTNDEVPFRELAARAALLRLSKEEIQLCGVCSSDSNNKNESDKKDRNNSGD